MKILVFLSALMLCSDAETVVKHLIVQEGGTQYTQRITLDHERNIQILEVPAHNNIIHSKTIFDFNQGLLFESHPETNTCYMKDIPEGVVSIKKFEAFLDKTVTVTASTEKSTRRVFRTSTKLAPHQLRSMVKEVITECGQSDVYQVEQIREEDVQKTYQRAPIGLVESFMADDDDCNMQGFCLWQTCQVGADSCWWTVNCDVNDVDCFLEHNSILHDCAGATNDCQISCTPCYNLECPGCEENWPACKPIFEANGVGTCPQDPDLGKDCGQVFCRMHDNIPGGEWDCAGFDEDNDDLTKIPEHTTCILWCPAAVPTFGWMITCSHDGTWDESGLTPGC